MKCRVVILKFSFKNKLQLLEPDLYVRKILGGIPGSGFQYNIDLAINEYNITPNDRHEIFSEELTSREQYNEQK